MPSGSSSSASSSKGCALSHIELALPCHQELCASMPLLPRASPPDELCMGSRMRRASPPPMSLPLLPPHDNCVRRVSLRSLLCDSIFPLACRRCAASTHAVVGVARGRRAPVARSVSVLARSSVHGVVLRRTRGFRCGSVSSTLGPARAVHSCYAQCGPMCRVYQTRGAGRVSNVGLYLMHSSSRHARSPSTKVRLFSSRLYSVSFFINIIYTGLGYPPR